MIHEAPDRVILRHVRFADMATALDVAKSGYQWLMENNPDQLGQRNGIGYRNPAAWPHMNLYVYRPSPDSLVVYADYPEAATG